MITRQDIAYWSVDHPWQTEDQIEQDLLLSQAICEIANDDILVTAQMMIRNLKHKLDDTQFCNDMNNLIRQSDVCYDPNSAGEIVINKLLKHL